MTRRRPALGPAGWRRLDTAFSKLKLDLGVTADEVARDPVPGPVADVPVTLSLAVHTSRAES